jgi:multidrug efflux system membrane fusion protein
MNKKILVFILVFCFAFGCAKKPKQEIHPRPVETALAKIEDVPIYIDSFGNLNPPYDVDIAAQVTGKVIEARFSEGQEVRKGDLLFVIDPAPYKAALDKAEGALAQDLADLKLNQETLERNKKLLSRQLISQQDFDQFSTNVCASEAKVKMDRAEIELAKINLEYCYIRSPIDGRTGKRLVDPGNIVSANTGPALVNIKTIDNLYMDFTIPEVELTRVRKAMSEGKLKVDIFPEKDETNAHSGILEFLDNAVDNTTGTVLLRAIVSNRDRALWPGQFVTVRLILGIEKNAVIVPYEAVQLGQNGPYLFVVTAQNKADLRLVASGARWHNSLVIKNGVREGETVVTSGQLGLSPGMPVIDIKQVKEN